MSNTEALTPLYYYIDNFFLKKTPISTNAWIRIRIRHCCGAGAARSRSFFVGAGAAPKGRLRFRLRH